MQTLRQAASIAAPSTEEQLSFFKKVLKNLKSMLADHEDADALSSKRVISFLAFLCLVIAFFVDLFTDFQITQGVYDSMMWIVVGGLGITGIEKFAKK
jgi:hypothetical protein